MADSAPFVFTHRELVELMIRKRGIHEGIWGLYVRFGIGAANLGTGPDTVNPTAVVPVLELGIQKFPEESNIAVDAAKVNPSLKENVTAATILSAKIKRK